MRREVVWAIIAGIILGLIVAFGVWRIKSSVSKNKKVVNNIVEQTPAPTPISIQEFKVVLDKPLNNDITTENSIIVSGITKPGLWVVISGESGDYIIQSDTSGAFSENIELIAGVNQIKVTAFDSTGSSQSTNVLVVYSSNFQQRVIPSPSPSAGEASESSSIRQKVAQDIANTISRPKAYIGTVTDITEKTIEIKNPSSDIQQLSIDALLTNVTNSVGATSKQVKTTDIAIGDFIVAMGYVGKNSVLDAQRILITSTITPPNINAFHAKVTSFTKKSLVVLNNIDNTESTVQPDSNTDIYSVKDGKSTSIKLGTITNDDIVLYTSTVDSKKTVTIRSIFKI